MVVVAFYSSCEMHEFPCLRKASQCPAIHHCFKPLLPVQILAFLHQILVTSLRKLSLTHLTHLELAFLGLSKSYNVEINSLMLHYAKYVYLFYTCLFHLPNKLEL